jgi:DNA-binding MarR family transcriptional regulator
MLQPLDRHRPQPQRLNQPRRGLTPTARLVLLYLDQVPGGARVEDIAVNTGSKYRWVEATVQRLNRAGLLHRVGPNMYAIADQVVSA